MAIKEILISMRGQPQNEELDLALKKILISKYNNGKLNFRYEEFNEVEPDDFLNLFRVLKDLPILIRFQLFYFNISETTMNIIGVELLSNRSLTQLDLSSSTINDFGFLAQALIVNNTLRELNLNNSGVKDEALILIANALKHNTGLTSLELQNNDISASGNAALCAALKVNVSLTSLDLSMNKIRDEGVIALSELLLVNKTLMHLYIFSNTVTKPGAQALAQTLAVNTALKIINFHGNPISSIGMFYLTQSLSQNTNLDSLSIGDPSIKNEELNDLTKTICSENFIETGLIRPGVLNIFGTLACSSALIEFNEALILRSNRMHERAAALGEALHPNPLPVSVAALIGNYDNVLSEMPVPSLLYAFQNKKQPSEAEIETINKKAKLKMGSG